MTTPSNLVAVTPAKAKKIAEVVHSYILAERRERKETFLREMELFWITERVCFRSIQRPISKAERQKLISKIEGWADQDVDLPRQLLAYDSVEDLGYWLGNKRIRRIRGIRIPYKNHYAHGEAVLNLVEQILKSEGETMFYFDLTQWNNVMKWYPKSLGEKNEVS